MKLRDNCKHCGRTRNQCFPEDTLEDGSIRISETVCRITPDGIHEFSDDYEHVTEDGRQ